MSLSCSCDYDDAEWWYRAAEDFAKLDTKRARKCCSCGQRINVGDDCLSFRRWRNPGYDTIEEKIYGEDGEIPLATWYMCERCGGLYMSVSDLGFCCDIQEDLAIQIKEYAAENAKIRGAP